MGGGAGIVVVIVYLALEASDKELLDGGEEVEADEEEGFYFNGNTNGLRALLA